MKLIDIPGDHIRTCAVPGQSTAGSADVFALMRAEHDLTVTAVYWIPAAAVTGNDTNYFSLKVQNEGTDGSGTTAVTDTKAYTASVDGVQGVPEALTLSSTAANLDVDEGEALTLVRAVAASGLAMPDGIVEVHYKYR